MTPEKCLQSLPQLLKFNDGTDVQNQTDWLRRREEVYEAAVPPQYGILPPKPETIAFEKLHECGLYVESVRSYLSGRIRFAFADEMTFGLNLYLPHGEGPFPVVICGDGCWPRYFPDSVIDNVVSRGYVLATFNRCELAEDLMKERSQDYGLYNVAPKGNYGAIGAWAWGYHRVIDVFEKMDFIDSKKISIVGHSRGGKTVLLAAATDERVALVGENCSGTGGAGCYHFPAQGAETLADLLGNFPYWFNPEFEQWISRDLDMPFDQHFIKALIAPRPQINMRAEEDIWANPVGTEITFKAAKEVYELFGAEDKFRLTMRPGIHAFKPEDWNTFLNFADEMLRK